MPHFGENWDDADYPLAYLITIRTYGTWLHGDERGSVDTHDNYNRPGSPRRPPNRLLYERMRENMKFPAVLLNSEQRRAVARAIEEVCKFRDYQLKALNIRTNHGHVVVAAQSPPEKIANAFKSYSTRELRRCGLINADAKVWARGRSRRYLWRENHVAAAIDYVLYCQGAVTFEDWYVAKYM
jgi:REP element-mobilizing transposase RayT